MKCRPGDFISYDTTSGGHSVVFIDWLRDERQQNCRLQILLVESLGHHGVGYGSGKFSDVNKNGRGIVRKSLRIGRVGAIKDYAKFDRTTIPQRNAYAPTQPDRIAYLPAPTPASASSE